MSTFGGGGGAEGLCGFWNLLARTKEPMTTSKPSENETARIIGKLLKLRALSLCFREKDQAIDYAQNRACFCSGEIRVLDSTGKLERTIAFSEVDRKL